MRILNDIEVDAILLWILFLHFFFISWKLIQWRWINCTTILYTFKYLQSQLCAFGFHAFMANKYDALFIAFLFVVYKWCRVIAAFAFNRNYVGFRCNALTHNNNSFYRSTFLYPFVLIFINSIQFLVKSFYL